MNEGIAAAFETVKTGPGSAGPWSRLFGYDIFISFALGPPPRGTRSYASDLARRLREAGFTVFFSEDEAPAGAGLTVTLRRALLRSRLLVVVANRATLADPRWVRTEVELFRQRFPRRTVVPINIDGALQDLEMGVSADDWLGFQGKIWIDEERAAAESGAPSEFVVRRMLTAPTATRSIVRLRVAALTLIVLLASITLWANWQRIQAEGARAAEKVATQRQGELRVVAESERDAANSARAGESEALRVAVQERDNAQIQQQLAEQRLHIAKSQEFAVRSELSLASDPHQSLGFALQGLASYSTFQAEAALRRAYRDSHLRAAIGGPGNPVRIARFTIDGQRLATLHFPWRVEIRSTQGFAIVARLHDIARGDTPVVGMEFVLDGSALMTWDMQGRVAVWDARSGSLIRSIRVDGNSFSEIWVHPAKGLLAVTSGIDRNRLELWDLGSGIQARVIEVGTDRITAAVFSSDGQSLLVATQNKDASAVNGYAAAHTTLRLFDRASGREQVNWPAGQLHVRGLAMDQTGGWIVSTIGDMPPPPPRGSGVGRDRLSLAVRTTHENALKLWRREGAGFQQVFTAETRQSPRVQMSADGRLVAFADEEETTVLSTQPVGIYRSLTGHKSFVTQVIMDGQGRSAVTASTDGTARLWDIPGRRSVCEFRGHIGGLRSAIVSQDHRWLATIGLDDSVRVWDTHCGENVTPVLAALPGEGGRSFQGYALTTLSSRWLGRFTQPGWFEWQSINGVNRGRLAVDLAPVSVIATAGKVHRLAFVTADGIVNLIDADRRTVRPLNGAWGFGALSDNGKVLVKGDREGRVRLYDWASGALLADIRRDGSFAEVSDLASAAGLPGAAPPPPRGSRYVRAVLDPTGTTLALSAIIDVELRRTKDGGLISRLAKHHEPIQQMVFSPDGGRLVTLAYGRVRGSSEAPILWSAMNGAMVNVLAGSQGIVATAAFTPDSREVLTASSEGHLRLWDAVNGTLHGEVQLTGGGLGGAVVVAISPTGDYAAIGRSDGLVQIVSLVSMDLLWEFRVDGDGIRSLTFDTDAGHLLVAFRDESIVRYACEVCAPLTQLRQKAESRVRAVRVETISIRPVGNGKVLAQ